MSDINRPPCEYCGKPREIIISKEGRREVAECANPECPSNDATSLDLLPKPK